MVGLKLGGGKEEEGEVGEGTNRTPLSVCVEPGTHLYKDPDRFYPMFAQPRGNVLIINNQEFRWPDIFPHRVGAHVDSDNLEQLFTQLGFTVTRFAHHQSFPVSAKPCRYSKNPNHNVCC